MIYRNINTPLQYRFCSMEFFLQLEIILPIVYNNNMVNFCLYYQSINIWVELYGPLILTHTSRKPSLGLTQKCLA